MAAAVMAVVVAVLSRSICFSFFNKVKCSYAVMCARNGATRAAPSELHGYAVTHLTHTHTCTHAHARLHACTHTQVRVARNGITA